MRGSKPSDGPTDVSSGVMGLGFACGQSVSPEAAAAAFVIVSSLRTLGFLPS